MREDKLPEVPAVNIGTETTHSHVAVNSCEATHNSATMSSVKVTGRSQYSESGCHIGYTMSQSEYEAAVKNSILSTQ